MIGEKSNNATFEIEAILNYELLSELMSYHSNLKILSPLELIEQIRDWASGVYLMPAFSRYDLTAQIIEQVK